MILASRHSRANDTLAPLKVRTSLRAYISFQKLNLDKFCGGGRCLPVRDALPWCVGWLVFPSDVCIDDDLTASGLLWLSELIEEHSKFAKVVGKRCIYVRLSLKSRPCARSVDNIAPTGHHLNTRLIGIHRFLAPSQDRVLHTLPRHIPAKFLRLVASHPPFLAIIRRVMHSSHRRPFYVVLPFRTRHARRASGVAQGISRRARGESALLR